MFDHATGYGHIYKIVPLKDIKELSIKFPNLPDQRGNWSNKSLSYLTHVLGHEGKNSLTSELIKQDLAMGVSVGPEMRVMGQKAGIAISVSLTDKGVQNYQEVMRIIFA
jgi:insulysin